MELTADMLINQLVQVKGSIAKLKKDLAGVSTPALGSGQPDVHITQVLNNRDRTLRSRANNKKTGC